MKKLLLSSLVLLAAASAVLAQAPTTITAKNEIVDGKRVGYWQLSALFLKMPSPWLPQQVVEQGNYDKSLKTGMWTRFYQNGKVESELTYVNNRANGPAKTYFESGQLQEEGTWVGNRWTGNYTMYYESGKVRQQFKYNALGQRDGEQLYYHPNGELNISVNIKAGKEDGWKKEYNDKGELVEETFYAGGTMDPSKTVKHKPKEDVKVAPEDQQEGTAPSATPGKDKTNIGKFSGTGGPHTLYNSDGFVSMKGTFKDWRLVTGEQFFYGPDGKVTRIKKFENGKYVGDGPLPTEEKSK